MPETRKQVLSMAINGGGMSDTSRSLGISKETVISTIAKQEDQLVSINPNIRQLLADNERFSVFFVDKTYCLKSNKYVIRRMIPI